MEPCHHLPAERAAPGAAYHAANSASACPSSVALTNTLPAGGHPRAWAQEKQRLWGGMGPAPEPSAEGCGPAAVPGGVQHTSADRCPLHRSARLTPSRFPRTSLLRRTRQPLPSSSALAPSQEPGPPLSVITRPWHPWSAAQAATEKGGPGGEHKDAETSSWRVTGGGEPWKVSLGRAPCTEAGLEDAGDTRGKTAPRDQAGSHWSGNSTAFYNLLIPKVGPACVDI